MATKRLGAKEFFADINEKPDATRVERAPNVDEKSMLSPAGKAQKEEDRENDEFRERHAQQLEARADKEHLMAKMGVDDFPDRKISYEEAKEMHETWEPYLRNAAHASRNKKTFAKKALSRFEKMDSKKNPKGWAKEFFSGVHDKEVK